MRLEVADVRLERLQVLLQLGAQRAPLRLSELRAHRLDPGLSRGQALLEVLREALHDARISEIVAGSTPRRAARSAMTAPYSSVTSPPVVETYWPLSSISFTNCSCAARTAFETRSWTRGEASAFSETFRASCLLCGRERSGQRLGAARQLLLELGLDIDVGVQLIDQVDAERLLHILVREDLVGRVLHLVRVEHLALHPVRGDRDEQQHRREHDQRPHERRGDAAWASGPAILRAPCSRRAQAAGTGARSGGEMSDWSGISADQAVGIAVLALVTTTSAA